MKENAAGTVLTINNFFVDFQKMRVVWACKQ